MGYHSPPALCRASGRQEVETKGMVMGTQGTSPNKEHPWSPSFPKL